MLVAERERVVTDNSRGQEWLGEREALFDVKPRVFVAMTGTDEKYQQLCHLLWGGMGIPSEKVLGITQFTQAGRAQEPVTPDPVALMWGKQQAQLDVFTKTVNSAENDRLRRLVDGKLTTFVSNDVNTTVGGIPLTKWGLQKGEPMRMDGHIKILMAGLKYLVANENNIDLGVKWPELMQSWEMVDSVLANKTLEGNKFFTTIDFQSIDAFANIRVNTFGAYRPVAMDYDMPGVMCSNRAFANIFIDWKSDEYIHGIVKEYFSRHWQRSDFTPRRYPLGIKWNYWLETLKSFQEAVCISVGEDGKGNESELELLLNGYNVMSLQAEYEVLRRRTKEDVGSVYVFTQKPEQRVMLNIMKQEMREYAGG